MLSQKKKQLNVLKKEKRNKMKSRACKICNRIYETEDKCLNCGAKESTESFKGRVIIINPEKSEIASKLGISKKGNFAIKTR